MEKENKFRHFHTKEEKQYCKSVLAEIEIQLPHYYAIAVKCELKRKGITNIPERYIQEVRNGLKYNRVVVDTLKAITEPAKLKANLSQKMDQTLASIR